MMQPFRHVPELHEFPEILERGIAPFVPFADEGRAIDRRKNEVAAAYDDRFLGIACMLRELRRGGFDELAGQPARDTHAFAPYIRPGLAPPVERGRILDEVHPDLFQHRFGVVLDDLQGLVAQQVEVGDVALDIAGGLDLQGGAFGAPGRPAAAPCPAPCGRFAHRLSPSRLGP